MSDHFIGTIYFLQVAFGLKSDSSNVSLVSEADVKTAIEYATKAVVPISLYAAQYGAVSLRVHPTVITYNAQVESKTVSDDDIRDIVDDVATRLPSDACVAILLPPDMDNSTKPRSEVNGYHDCSTLPYINSYVNDDKEKHPFLTVEDETFRYAYTLSHEIAEMAVDPKVSGQPEVCDSCSGAYQSAWICYSRRRRQLHRYIPETTLRCGPRIFVRLLYQCDRPARVQRQLCCAGVCVQLCPRCSQRGFPGYGRKSAHLRRVLHTG